MRIRQSGRNSDSWSVMVAHIVSDIIALPESLLFSIFFNFLRLTARDHRFGCFFELLRPMTELISRAKGSSV